MKRLPILFLFLLAAIPTFAQHRQPVETYMDANGKMLYVDFAVRDLEKPEATPDPQHVQIQKAGIFDFQCTSTPTNPPTGNARFYCDSGTGQMACLTSTGASCLGGGGGIGSVTSVGLAGPTGIPISNSPVTTTGTLTWAMPTGWVLGDLLIGNGDNSVARLAAPTTPDAVTEMLISTPSSGATQPQWGVAGLPGRVASGTTDTILATDRNPETVEYTSNSPTAITVPDPASSGFNGNPAFVTIAEGLGPYTFTPQTSAVITYCDGSNCFAGQPTLTLQKGQYATWSSPTTSNWFVRVASTQPISQPPVVNGLISGGGVVWTGLLNFTCSAATYAIGGTVYNSPQTNLTLSAADPTNPRIDVIAVNNSGACVAITGTPAGSPAAPSVDPTSQLALTFVTIAANATTPTLSSILVYDENSTPPTEYTCTPSANFNCNSTNNPFHLTHDIEATTAVATNNATLVNSGTVNFSTYSTLSFNIRNKASWPAAKSLQICFLNSTTVVGNCIAFKNGVFGFNQTNVTGYQQIVIPLSQFALGSTVADRVRFQVIGGGGSIGFYLDWIQIQSTLSGSGSSSFQLQVNGQNTQQTANIADNASVTWACTVAPGTTVSTCKATAIGAPPSGTAGGDLSGSYPNPTVAKVNAVAYPASPSTNTVPVVTSSNTITYEALPNSALANSATTVNSQTCTLGSSCTVTAAPSGSASGDLSGSYPGPTVAQVNGAVVPASAGVVGTNSSRQIVTATQTNIDAAGYVAGGGTANAQTATLAPAISAYTNGLRVCWLPTAANSTTTPTLAVNGLTAITIVKVGGAALAANDLTTTAVACAIKDSTNFELQNPQTTTAAGITSINTSATGPAVTIVGTGGATVSTSGNTVTVAGSLGPPSPSWQARGGTYTVPDSDNGFRDRFNSGGTVTLPQPNTISTSPLVGLRVNTSTSSTPFTSSTFSQSAGHQMVVALARNFGANAITSVTDTAGDSFTKKCEVLDSATPGSLSVWYASTIAASGSNAVTVTFSATPSAATVLVEELQGTTFDSISCNDATTSTTTVHFANAVALAWHSNNSNTEAPGFSTIANTNSSFFSYRLLSNSSQVLYNADDQGITTGVMSLSTSAAATFVAGWTFLAENVSTALVTITPTGSTINGQSTLVLVPNEVCSIMSNGVNYDATCGFTPNVQFNGAIGNAVQIGFQQNLSRNSDVGTTTIVQASSDSLYTVDADVNCDSAVSTGVATLTITFTDTSNTVQTYTTNAACTTLGSSSLGSIRQAFRAKASTNIQYGVTHTGTQPTFDVSVAINQLSTK